MVTFSFALCQKNKLKCSSVSLAGRYTEDNCEEFSLIIGWKQNSFGKQCADFEAFYSATGYLNSLCRTKTQTGLQSCEIRLHILFWKSCSKKCMFQWNSWWKRSLQWGKKVSVGLFLGWGWTEKGNHTSFTADPPQFPIRTRYWRDRWNVPDRGKIAWHWNLLCGNMIWSRWGSFMEVIDGGCVCVRVEQFSLFAHLHNLSAIRHCD